MCCYAATQSLIEQGAYSQKPYNADQVLNKERERESSRSLGTTKGKKITDRANIVSCMSRSFIRIHSRKEKCNSFAFVSVIRPKHSFKILAFILRFG